MLQDLRNELEEGFENGKFHWEDVHYNDAAGLLKQFLRELPVPLLTLDYLDAFAQVDSKYHTLTKLWWVTDATHCNVFYVWLVA